ncbi:unnamed protein product [Cyprideis torosa]|uniref:Uncharacterized protein n=1 Tax=Cyprideis torosa TaxID=163714 RepID=A0A7R8WHG2_9CRUS|nr:unnamed protein product [Cyprideis torosa]CAG0899368.1 unnamed protein product [Cyprideis torosa]
MKLTIAIVAIGLLVTVCNARLEAVPNSRKSDADGHGFPSLSKQQMEMVTIIKNMVSRFSPKEKLELRRALERQAQAPAVVVFVFLLITTSDDVDCHHEFIFLLFFNSLEFNSISELPGIYSVRVYLDPDSYKYHVDRKLEQDQGNGKEYSEDYRKVSAKIIPHKGYIVDHHGHKKDHVLYEIPFKAEWGVKQKLPIVQRTPIKHHY